MLSETGWETGTVLKTCGSDWKLRGALLGGLLLWSVCSGSVAPVQAQDPPKNPLNQLFQQLDRQLRGDPENARQSARDEIDLRVPLDADLSRRLEQAERLLSSERGSEAIPILQELVDAPEDRAIRSRDGQWGSLQTRVRQLLADLSPELRLRYNELYGREADALLAEAQENEDATLWLTVVRRFGTLPASDTARRRLLALSYSRGDLDEAIRWGQEIVRSAAAQPVDTVRLATLQAMRGERQIAAELLSRIPPGNWPAELPVNDPEGWLNRRQPVTGPEEAGLVSLPAELHPEWTQSRIQRYRIVEAIQHLSRQLRENGISEQSTSELLVTPSLVITRDLSGLQARDLQTGETRWRVIGQERDQLESRLADELDPTRVRARQLEPYNSSENRDNLETRSLANVLFRDAITPALSAADEQIYTIEQQDPLQPISISYYYLRNPESSETPSWAVNELVCRDLNTGRQLWAVGGPAIEPIFSRPLADSYFFGPPTPYRDSLFVIAEQQGDISLHELSARTGEVLRSQLLASAGLPLGQDPLRRMWRCRPVITGDLIICPTTTGWLTAIDLQTREIRWLTRLIPHEPEQRQRFRSSVMQHLPQPLNTRWSDPAVQVVHDHILVCPPEIPDELNRFQSAFFCLNRAGEILWQLPKQDLLNLVGLEDGSLLAIGRHDISKFELRKGERLWRTVYPTRCGLPTGRGVVVGREFLLPLGGDRLLRIQTESGEILQMARVTAPELSELGNLSWQNGMLISISPRVISLFRFDSQATDEATLARANELRQPLAPVERLLDRGAVESAWNLLQQRLLAAETWPKDLRSRAAALEWQLLLKLSSQAGGETEHWLERLEQQAGSEEQRLMARVARARFHSQRGEILRAAGIWLELVGVTQPPLLLSGSREVRLDVLAGWELQALLESLSRADREEIDRMIEATLNSARSSSSVPQHQVALALSFHPRARAELLEIARSARTEHLTLAAICVWRVAACGTPAEGLTALQELGVMLEQAGRLDEALLVCQEALARFDLETQSGEAQRSELEQRVEALRTRLQQLTKSWDQAWREFPLRADLTGGKRRPGMLRLASTLPDEAGLRTVLGHQRFSYHAESQRLLIEQARDGSAWWSVPLRSLNEAGGRQSLRLLGTAAYVLAQHGGVLHALGVSDRELLWQFVPPGNQELSSSGLSSRPARLPGLVSGDMFRNWLDRNLQAQPGAVVAANELIVLVQVPQLTALDALTGAVLWREVTTSSPDAAADERLGRRIFVLRGRDLICSDTQRKCDIRDALTGELRTTAIDLLPVGTRIVQQHFIRFTKSEGLGAEREWTLQARRLRDNGLAWEKRFPEGTQFGLLGERELLSLNSAGLLSLLHLVTGEQSELGVVPADLLSRQRKVTPLADADRVFLVVELERPAPDYSTIPSLPANGVLLAFSRTAGLLWSRSTASLSVAQAAAGESGVPREGQSAEPALSIPLPDFEALPVLLLMGAKSERRGDLFFRNLRVVCLDKQSGEVRLDWKLPSDQAGFVRLAFRQEDGCLELDSFNFRLQIRPELPIADLHDVQRSSPDQSSNSNAAAATQEEPQPPAGRSSEQ